MALPKVCLHAKVMVNKPKLPQTDKIKVMADEALTTPDI